jgi:hypothetical protein
MNVKNAIATNTTATNCIFSFVVNIVIFFINAYLSMVSSGAVKFRERKIYIR